MRSDLLNVNSDSYSLSKSGASRVLKQVVSFTASSATIASGAMELPEKALITRLTVVCTSAAAYATATLGIKVGTAADGAELVVSDADGLEASASAQAAGLGVSTWAELNTALSGPTAHVIVAGTALQDAGTDIHFTITASTGAFTAGEYCFIVDYIPVKDNV